MITPKVISSTQLAAADAKWITLKKIAYLDAEGQERLWECAERKTRKSTGIDGISAVAVLAILRSKTSAFPASTIVIEQYRPPIDKFIVELPAGLIDEGETPEQAAIRELEEETGFKADSVIESSPVVVVDPGMTNANMKLVVLGVVLDDKLELPDQKLEAGEFIVRRVVELSKLNSELKDYDTKACCWIRPRQIYVNKIFQGFVVDARLSHFASGYDLAARLK
ncbi:hypothetical protein DXG01_006575 [Tephrocybe rancida]|nr:hypothetical protein DXG01_006575 [Tephrocybe rancida]